MVKVSQIDSYVVYVPSHPKFNEWDACILLRFQGKTVVDVRFVSDGDHWASHGYVDPGAGSSTIYIGIERYSWFVDILRNERPLFVALYPVNPFRPPLMVLQTGAEPVGEAENP